MRRAARKAQIPLDVLVDAQAKAAGWPMPLREHKFHPKRRWRLDYYWPKHPSVIEANYSAGWMPLAVEIEGGVWTHGRHTRGSGFVKDMEKYNEAACAGISLIRLTPQQVRAGELQTWLEKMR